MFTQKEMAATSFGLNIYFCFTVHGLLYDIAGVIMQVESSENQQSKK